MGIGVRPYRIARICFPFHFRGGSRHLMAKQSCFSVSMACRVSKYCSCEVMKHQKNVMRLLNCGILVIFHRFYPFMDAFTVLVKNTKKYNDIPEEKKPCYALKQHFKSLPSLVVGLPDVRPNAPSRRAQHLGLHQAPCTAEKLF